MRTIVEIPDVLRARLLEIAGRRGEKGFSRLIEEALIQFLDQEDERAKRIQAAFDTLGTLSESEVVSLESTVTELRGSWR